MCFQGSPFTELSISETSLVASVNYFSPETFWVRRSWTSELLRFLKRLAAYNYLLIVIARSLPLTLRNCIGTLVYDLGFPLDLGGSLHPKPVCPNFEICLRSFIGIGQVATLAH